MIKINTNKQVVEYRGIFFPFITIKKVLQQSIPQEQLLPFCIFKSFNTRTGEIERKYAWNSVLEHLAENGTLLPILENIIEKESLKDLIHDINTAQETVN
jgi:hypothetical protein